MFTDDQVQVIAQAIVFCVRPFLLVWIFSTMGSFMIRLDEYRHYKKFLKQGELTALNANKNA